GPDRDDAAPDLQLRRQRRLDHQRATLPRTLLGPGAHRRGRDRGDERALDAGQRLGRLGAPGPPARARAAGRSAQRAPAPALGRWAGRGDRSALGRARREDEPAAATAGAPLAPLAGPGEESLRPRADPPAETFAEADRLAGALAIAAGLIHFYVAPAHFAEE